MSHFWQKPINIVAGAVVVLGMMGLTATTAAAHSARPEAKSAGTVVYSDYEYAPTLNIYQYNGIATAEQDENILAFGLGPFYGPSGQIEPGFFNFKPGHQPGASNGGKTYNFSLRKGLKWSNGKPITATDLKFWWHVAMNKNSGPFCTATCDVIKSVTVHGATGITFHLKSPTPSDLFAIQDSPGFLPYGWSGLGKNQKACLAKISACGGIASKLWTDQNFNYESSKYVTSGPYVVKSFSNGTLNTTHFAPNKYWRNSFVGQSGVTPVSDLEYLQFASQVSMLTAGVATDTTNATTDITPLNIPTARASMSSCHGCGWHFSQKASYDEENLFFNDYNKTVNIDGGPSGVKNPVANTKVRLALSLAYARAQLAANAYGLPLATAKKYISYQTPFTSTAARPNPFRDPAITGAWDPIRGKDVAPGTAQAFKDAKALLKQAGFPHPTIYITTNGTGNVARHNEVDYLASNHAWGKIGVKVQYIDKEAGDLFNDWNGGGLGPHGHFEIMIFAYTDISPLPDGWYANLLSSYCPQTDTTGNPENDQNWSCIHNKTIDTGFHKMATTQSESVRHHWADVILTQMNRNAYWSQLTMRPDIQTWDKHVKGVSTNPSIGGMVNWDPWGWHFAS